VGPHDGRVGPSAAHGRSGSVTLIAACILLNGRTVQGRSAAICSDRNRREMSASASTHTAPHGRGRHRAWTVPGIDPGRRQPSAAATPAGLGLRLFASKSAGAGNQLEGAGGCRGHPPEWSPDRLIMDDIYRSCHTSAADRRGDRSGRAAAVATQPPAARRLSAAPSEGELIH
jgi:hypothetical protein